MATNFFKVIRNTVKHWYLPLLVGLLFIGVGIFMFTKPTESYVALAQIFSLLFIFNGIADIIFSIANKDELEGWGWNLAAGIFSLIIGVVLVRHPEITLATLPLFVGFTVLFRSIMAISSSLELKSYGVLDWGNLLAIGILGLIFSTILLWNPFFAGLSIVVWTAMALIVFGIWNIYYSTKLKKLNDIPKKISDELKKRRDQIEEEISKELMS